GQIGQVAGMDEAVIIDADGDALCHQPGPGLRLRLVGSRSPRLGPRVALEPCFTRFWGDVSHAPLNAQVCTGVRPALPAPILQEGGELRTVWHLDLKRYQLVAALPAFAGEALALVAQHLARA